jgi:hypothetical protein
MKKIVMALALLISLGAQAQDCGTLVVNLKKGTLNGVKPTATQEQVKGKLPCFTGDTEEGGDMNCGGGVFYLNNDFFCYTGRDYIEIRKRFNGKLSVPVLGMAKAGALQKLGMGKPVRTETDGEKTFVFLKTRYGCLVLTVTSDKVTQLAMHAKAADKVVLCL